MRQVTMGAVDPSLYELIEQLEQAKTGQTINTDAAIAIGANIIRNEWKKYAMGAKIPGSSMIQLKNPISRLASSIRGKKIGNQSWIIYSDNPISRFYDDDTGEKDYKLTHPYGRKSRVSKKGIPYLIVPFRWNTKTGSRALPEPVYKQLISEMKKGNFDKSRVNPRKSYTQENYSGQPIKRQGYDWGSSLKGVSKKDPSLKKLEGLVVMDTSTPRRQSSAYFTFRVISAKSPQGSWINPERPSLTKHAVNNTINDVVEVVKIGIMKDLGL